MDTGRREEGRARQSRAEQSQQSQQSISARRRHADTGWGLGLDVECRLYACRRRTTQTCMCCCLYGCATMACVRPSPQRWIASVNQHTRANSRGQRDRDAGRFLDSHCSPACPRRHSINAPLFAYKTSHPSAHLSLFTFALALFFPSVLFLSPRSPSSCCPPQCSAYQVPRSVLPRPPMGRSQQLIFPFCNPCPCPSRSFRSNNSNNRATATTTTTLTVTSTTVKKRRPGLSHSSHQMIYVIPSSIFTGSRHWANCIRAARQPAAKPGHGRGSSMLVF